MATKKPKAPAKKAPAKKAVGGRPTLYSEALAEKICQRIANGDSLVTIGKDAKFPARSTIMKWLADSACDGFVDKYTRAKEDQADFYAAQVIEIADKVRPVVKKTLKDDGKVEEVHTDGVERSRLMMDARKWYASKLAPKKYGDKIAVGGADDLPEIKSVHSLSTETLLAIAAKAS